MGLRGIAVALVVLAFAGCEEPDRSSPDFCVAPAPGQRFNVTMLVWGRENPIGRKGVVPGVDVDGLEGTSEDPHGCFHWDFRWPEDAATVDVDNQLGPIMSSLGGSVDADGAYAAAIAAGTLRITIELGPSAPGPDCERAITWIDGDSRMISVGLVARGDLIDVRFTERLFFPVYVGATRVNGILQNVRLRMDLSDPDASTAVIGGAVSLVEANRVTLELLEDPKYADLIADLLEMNADLVPDPSGDCQGISAGWLLTGTLTELTL